ncbi:MAG: hypothetical protein KY475_27440 [Planctomycetes bacterium]|nr:hypothetical protein [Planctomycetota bacterium]
MIRSAFFLATLGVALANLSTTRGDDAQAVSQNSLEIFENYGEAYAAAQQRGEMLAIFFYDDNDDALLNHFESEVLADSAVQEKLAHATLALLPRDTTIVANGETSRLLDHPSFAQAKGLPGVAIIDLAHKESRHYGHVVTIYPLKAGRRLTPKYFAEMLALPPGSLTQRTLIFAVRVHPESPASARSAYSPVLAAESESHSRHQASIGLQGHHNWDHRFQRINARFTGLTSQEVCAESWPGQDLVDAAFECVDSWRQSPGHWSAVRRRHNFFGFDMKRGRNGIWYGTGIFARR